jgi:hypothetical protein
MAINKNHEFEDLDGVKCAIVERNALQGRVDFLKPLLEFNGYTVLVVATPPPKTTAKPAATAAPAEGAVPPVVEAPPPPSTFTVGVTDVTFNSINALYGRLLRTTDGRVVTPAYWEQKETVSHDEIPYYEHTV